MTRDEAVAAIIAAIEQPGRSPAYHRAIMSRHRREWPVLWRAIDALRAAERGQR